jgi:class 3 adenylate cyclase
VTTIDVARPGPVDTATPKTSALRRPRARGRFVFAVLVLVIAVIATTCLVIAVRAIDQPFAGFLYYPFRNVGSVGSLDWPGLKAGARYQDIIREVNGVPVSTSAEVQRIVAGARVGESIHYVLDRSGSIFSITVPVSRFTAADFVKLFGPLFLAGVFFSLVAVAVYFLKPDTAASWAFSIFCFSLGSYMIGGLPIQLPPHFVWLYTLNVLAQPIYPAALLHLSLLFPERTTLVTRRPWIQYAPYAVSAVLGAYMLADIRALAAGTSSGDALLAIHARLLREISIARAYALIGASSIVFASARVLWRSRSPIARQRSRVILLGSAVAFLPPTIVMPLVLLAKIGVPFNLVVIPAFAFPMSVGYAIARHNLFDVDVYIKRALGYGSMTAVVGVGYLSAQTFVRTVILDPLFGTHADNVYPILFAVLIVFFFNPISQWVQGNVDRIFFRKRLDYKETISTVSNALTSMLNLEQIITQVIGTLRGQMFVETAGVVILQPKTRECRAVFVGGQDNAAPDAREAPVIHYDDPLLVLLRERKTLITRYEIEEDARYRDVRQVCLERFSALGASIAIPLKYHEEVTGMLALGDKKSGQFYGREDVDLLGTMADQAAVAIQNATAHEEVVRYAEELAESLRRIQTLESIKSNLAKFVPKTVQDLIEESPEAPSLEKREADLSVVFADITGYTRLSATMELDQVNQLVEKYFGAFLDEIVKQGGDVNETVGDGLMVIFRAPEPRRHARAAVLAALGIQRRTAEINAELQGQFEPIEMHVGVNSGIASVGATKIEGAAGTRWTYTASGPTTNVAARLAALGEGGYVVVSEETRRRLGDEIDAEDLGLQALKNVAQPVRVYRVKPGDAERLAASEQRRHPRRTVSWPVRLWIGDTQYEGRAVDFSEQGLRLVSVPQALLKVGESYRIEILGFGEPRIVKGEVRRITDRGVGTQLSEQVVPPDAPVDEPR